MHCPKCGQQQVSEDTRFCSRCGFLLTGVAEIVANGGVIPGSLQKRTGQSPRSRGLKQGAFVFMLSFLFVPLVAILMVGLRLSPFPIAVTAILLTVGGLLRVAYALMFESSEPGAMTLEERLLSSTKLKGVTDVPALPAQQSIPATDYASPAGAWRDTNELAIPHSVTDNTTKLLEKEQDH
ncbi:MAG TPA: zinc ribbon domain-containing protein [Pyrinomonadaceae bacterium]|jgi:hypothetical protein|nr:zinc ribbon domain-containing protein [Pyrinomonadaceae bacterium]